MKKILVLTLFLIAAMILTSPAFGTIANSGTYMFTEKGNDNNFNNIEQLVNSWFSDNGYDYTSDLTKFEKSNNGAGSTSGTWETDDPVNFYSLKAGQKGYAMFWLETPATQGNFSTETYLTNKNGKAQGLSHITFYTDNNYNPVPIPGAAWLLGSGMVGLLALRRRRKSAQ